MTTTSTPTTARRSFIAQAALGLLAAPALAKEVDFGFPGGTSERTLTTVFPQKAAMILQRTRPPLLETPFEVFDGRVFTPNDQFFVRWHWAGIPKSVDVETFRLIIDGSVNTPVSLSLNDLQGMKRVELVAINQMLRELAWLLPAACRWGAMGQRRHGQRTLGWDFTARRA